MRITAITANNIPPVRSFAADGLGSVVIVAGANGSGKSRLKDSIVAKLQNPNHPNINLTIEATRPRETSSWGTNLLSIPGPQSAKFLQYMQGSSSGVACVGSVIQIESNRSAAKVKFQQLTLATPDPDDVAVNNSFYLQPLTTRWSHTVNAIYQKVANRDQKIAQFIKANPTSTGAQAIAQIPDPFIKYQTAFKELLPGKILEPLNAKQLKEFHFRAAGTGPLPFNALSSGEQEVVRVVFGLLRKEISHSIILVDEPELHLHPTLAFRLIETMRKIGNGTNQFIFFTHSADLISTYYSTGNVFFIDQNATAGNQARRLSDLDETHTETAQAIGNNLGMFAVGRCLVFVEGEDSSVDRMTYNRIAQLCLPDSSVVPIGSVESVRALARFSEELNRTIFGLDFFMIRDRDGLTDQQLEVFEKNPRARCLKRRHVENYYLDPIILSQVAKNFYLPDEWHDPSRVTEALKQIARDNLKLAVASAVKEYVTINGTLDSPKCKSLQEKTDEQLKNEISGDLAKGLDELNSEFSAESLHAIYDQFATSFESSLNDETWISRFPGKLLFNLFCGKCLKQDVPRIRQAYLDLALKSHQHVFEDIFVCFRHFSTITGAQPA